jgi:hypothetical protein
MKPFSPFVLRKWKTVPEIIELVGLLTPDTKTLPSQFLMKSMAFKELRFQFRLQRRGPFRTEA